MIKKCTYLQRKGHLFRGGVTKNPKYLGTRTTSIEYAWDILTGSLAVNLSEPVRIFSFPRNTHRQPRTKLVIYRGSPRKILKTAYSARDRAF